MTTTRWCPDCGSEYVTGVERCLDCDIELVETPPPDEDDAVDEPAGPTGTQVMYELHEWAGESRLLLEQLLTGAGITRAWEGTTMVIDQADEASVDEIVLDVESSAQPALDPDAPRVVYEVAEWTADQVTVLTDALTTAGLSYEFDIEGDLAVLADDEERVEELLDDLDFAAAVPDSTEGDDEDGDEDGDEEIVDEGDGTDAPGDADDGLETAEILSDLFVACDRLQHDATDHEGILGGVAAVDRIEPRGLPFGYSPAVWTDLIGQAVRLRSDLEDDGVSDDDIREHAQELRSLLRQYV